MGPRATVFVYSSASTGPSGPLIFVELGVVPPAWAEQDAEMGGGGMRESRHLSLGVSNCTRAQEGSGQVLFPGVGLNLDGHYLGQPRVMSLLAGHRGWGPQDIRESSGETVGITASSLLSTLPRGWAGRPGQ